MHWKYKFIIKLKRKHNLSINESQRQEVKNYIEELLDLYTEDEYESYLENIIFHYCQRKFKMSKEDAIRVLYEIIAELKWITY